QEFERSRIRRRKNWLGVLPVDLQLRHEAVQYMEEKVYLHSIAIKPLGLDRNAPLHQGAIGRQRLDRQDNAPTAARALLGHPRRLHLQTQWVSPRNRSRQECSQD